MAGYSSAGARSIPFIDTKLQHRKVMLFTKKHSPASKMARQILDEYKMDGKNYEVCEIECRQDTAQIENYFQVICLTDSRSVSLFYYFLCQLTCQSADIMSSLCAYSSASASVSAYA